MPSPDQPSPYQPSTDKPSPDKPSTNRRSQPEQQAPPVQRLRIHYAKRGRLRFTSHRDFSRAFERAVFRARIPMAYSSGFNPHPRISYMGAAPMGSASEAEYVEIALAEVIDPARAHADIDEALPEGLDVIEVLVSAGDSLADRLEGSRWLITLVDTPVEEARRAVEMLLATPEVIVERMTKKGVRSFDARAAIVSVAVPDSPSVEPPCAILDVVLRHGSPSVRPDDVLAALRETSGLRVTAALQQRLAQGPLDLEGGTVGDPLTPDRDAAGQ